MNNHRELKKIRLSDLQTEREVIRKKALNTCRQIMPMIDPTLSEVEEMDINSAANAMDKLVTQYATLLSQGSKISDLEEALYG